MFWNVKLFHWFCICMLIVVEIVSNIICMLYVNVYIIYTYAYICIHMCPAHAAYRFVLPRVWPYQANFTVFHCYSWCLHASDSRLEAEGRDRCCFNPRSDFGSMPLQDDACYTAAGNEDVLDDELFQLGCQTEFACRKLEKRVLRLRRVER